MTLREIRAACEALAAMEDQLAELHGRTYACHDRASRRLEKALARVEEAHTVMAEWLFSAERAAIRTETKTVGVMA